MTKYLIKLTVTDARQEVLWIEWFLSEDWVKKEYWVDQRKGDEATWNDNESNVPRHYDFEELTPETALKAPLKMFIDMPLKDLLLLLTDA